MKSKRFISLSILSVLGIATLGSVIYSTQAKEKPYVPTFAAYPTGDADTYYAGIDDSLMGNDLLSALRSLNSKKRQKTGGYSNLLKNEFYARYTDYDINTVKYDSNNRPYSDNIVSFYSGNLAANGKGMNREHVWPDSRGGNLVEADTHMARPTLTSENSARGNSFYVEGMKSTKDGWDPGKESWGDATYRGDSARIIFYCVVANNQLSLVDLTNDGTGNKTMGKLSDMLKWNVTYSVQQREMNRNEGVEYIQGNRNPFIDHPEYACRIWGNTNSDTKSICAPYLGPSVTMSSKSLSVEEEKTSTLNAVSSNSSDITWSVADSSVVSLSSSTSASKANVTITGLKPGKTTVTAKATINGKEYSDTCEVTVTAKPVPVLTSITLSGSYPTAFKPGDTFSSEGLVVTAYYTTGNSKVVTDYTIDKPNMSEAGTKIVTVHFSDGGVNVSASYDITIDILDHISVSGGKRAFALNETFSYEGLVVTAYYSVANSRVVTPTSVSSPDMSSLGEKDVTVTYSENGVEKSATYKIEVKEEVLPIHVESISLNETKKEVAIGSTFQLVATINPSNADNQSVRWSISFFDGYDGCASVSESGLVTGISLGYATVLVTSVDGGKTASCQIRVVEKVNPPKPSESSSGCGGNIMTTSIVLSALSLTGVAVILLKKKKEK